MCYSKSCTSHVEKNDSFIDKTSCTKQMNSYGTERILKDFSEGLRKFVASRVSNYSHVDDILQDVFIKIHMNIDSLKDSTKVKSWVFQIAHNTIIDFYRKLKIKAENIDDIIIRDSFSDSTIEKLHVENPEQEIASGLMEMIDALPEKYSQALFLVEIQGLSQVELAKQLGISVSGAKSRVQRGRQMLKDSLMNCCHFEFDRYGTIIDFHPICCCCCNKK